MQCFRVSVPPAVGPTLLRQVDMGFLTSAQFGACRIHKSGPGTYKSAQELTRRDKKLPLALFRPGIEPRVFALVEASSTALSQ